MRSEGEERIRSVAVLTFMFRKCCTSRGDRICGERVERRRDMWKLVYQRIVDGIARLWKMQ